jgi:hypothetical protein
VPIGVNLTQNPSKISGAVVPPGNALEAAEPLLSKAEPSSRDSQPEAGNEATILAPLHPAFVLRQNLPSLLAGRGLRGASAAGGFPSAGDWRVG